MTFIIIIIFILFVVIVFIIENSKKPDLFYFKVTNTFLKTYNPKEEEELNLWLNEITETLYIYLKGTGGGQGKVGTIKQKSIVSDYKKYDFCAKIKKIIENKIVVEFYIQKDTINQ